MAPSARCRCDLARTRRSWLPSFPEFFAERSLATQNVAMAAIECVLSAVSIALFILGVVQFSVAVIGADVTYGAHILAGIVACAAYLYGRRFERATAIWREWLVILTPFILIARVAPYAIDPDLFGRDLAAWLQDPTALFDAGFLFRIVLLLSAWIMAFATTADLIAVRVQRGELSSTPPRTVIERAWESDRIRAIDHTTPLVRLAGRLFGFGLALLFLAALSSLTVGQRLSLDAVADLFRVGRASVASAQMTVVAYFLASLGLIAHAYYARQCTIWTLDSVAIAPDLGRRWSAIAVGVAAAAAVLAFALPTSGLLGLADIVHLLLRGLVTVGSYLMLAMFFVFWVLTYPLRFLVSDVAAPPSESGFRPPPAMDVAPSDSSLFDVLRTLLIWTLVLGLPLYSASGLWSRRGGGIAARGRTVVMWLRDAFAALARIIVNLLRGARDVTIALVDLVAGRARAIASGQYPRVPARGRGYRSAIVAVFAVVLSRADRHGIARRRGQTAVEWTPDLARAIPSAAQEIAELTTVFNAARYGPDDPTGADVGVARHAWTMIRRCLAVRVRVP